MLSEPRRITTPAHDFEQYMAWFSSADFTLPFEFGGATQCGRLNDHNNNQDSLVIIGEADRLVGVVCDGCASSARGYSNNEVGARLISILVANLVTDLLRSHGVGGMLEKLSLFESTVCERILQVARVIVKEEQLDAFLESFLMTTIIVMTVDSTDFGVFGCGDGFLAVNDEIKDLDDSSGNYLASRLINCKNCTDAIDAGKGAIEIIAQGKTKELNSLLIGTDGFTDLQKQFPHLIGAFVSNTDMKINQRGYNETMTAEFRRRVWYQDEVESWAEFQNAHDDRSFILLRRERVGAKEESKRCSKSRRRKSRKQADSLEQSQVSVRST